MMRVAFVVGCLALAGCEQEPELKLKNASVEQVAAEVNKSGIAAETRFQPGAWRIETQVQDVVGEGVPPQLLQQMKAQMSALSSDTQCLTPEQAARPSSEMFAGKQRGGSCKYDSFEMSDGRMKATMSCPNSSGAKMAMTMDGTYSKTSYQVNSAMRMENGAPGQSMTVKVQSKGTRTGECAS